MVPDAWSSVKEDWSAVGVNRHARHLTQLDSRAPVLHGAGMAAS